MRPAKPYTAGWTKTRGKKEYTHTNGVVIRYIPNAWAWEVIGGPECGQRWNTLNVAQYFAVERFVQ